MNTKHTPGPWTFRDVGGAGLIVYGPVPFQANCVEFTLKATDQPLFDMANLDCAAAYKQGATGYPMLAYETWLQFPPKEWTEMQTANARLIATAPELLEVCQKALAKLSAVGFDVGPDGKPTPLVAMLRNAIAKAIGEPRQ